MIGKQIVIVALAWLIALTGVPAAAATNDAHAVLARWRHAIGADTGAKSASVTIIAKSRENGEDAMVTTVTSADGRYREIVSGKNDRSETVLSGPTGWTRDWNGDVRELQGKELQRVRAAAFVSRCLAFGPPATAEIGAVSDVPGTNVASLRLALPGSAPTTWYFDAGGLPQKIVRGSDEGDLTIVPGDWRVVASRRLPHLLTETGGAHKGPRMTFTQRVTFDLANGSADFSKPSPGPSDVRWTRGTSSRGIHFNFENAHVMVQGMVNGHGPVWLLLDTGASQTLVNAERVAQLGIRPYGASSVTGGGGSADYASAKDVSFSLPGVELLKQHTGVLGIGGLERLYGMEMGGLLGYDFFSRFVVELDYTTQSMNLYDPRSYRYDGNGITVPFIIDDNLPYTDGSVSFPTERDIPAHFIIDSGAADTLNFTSPFVKEHRLLEVAAITSDVLRTPASDKEFFTQANVRGRLDRLRISAIDIGAIPVNFSVAGSGAYSDPTFAGTIGEGILRRYKVIFDYSRHRMILEPTPGSAQPFPERRSFGLGLISGGADLRTFMVSGVRPSSPAATAGFKTNDIIIAVDAKPTSALTLGQVREALQVEGKQYLFTIMRGQERINLPVTVTLIPLDRSSN